MKQYFIRAKLNGNQFKHIVFESSYILDFADDVILSSALIAATIKAKYGSDLNEIVLINRL